MKTNAIVRIVIFSITILVLAGILLGGLAFHFLSVRYFDTDTTEESYNTTVSSDPVSLDPSRIREIEIEWVSGSITIQSGNVESITVQESTVSDDKNAMVWKQEGNTLSIEFSHDDLHIGLWGGTYTWQEKDLVITVPQGWECDSMEIDTASSDVEIRDLRIREVELDAASADCTFSNCHVDKLDVDTASGDVEFTGTLQILDFDAASASFIGYMDAAPSRIDVDSASGNLELTLPEGSGFSVKVEGLSSDFSSEFPTTVHNGRYVCGDESCRIQVSAMSGDVIIRNSGANAACPIPYHNHTQACFEAGSSCPAPEHTHSEECCIYGDDCTDPEHSHSRNHGANHN